MNDDPGTGREVPADPDEQVVADPDVAGDPDAAGDGATSAGVLRSSAVMAAGTVVSRITGMVRDIVLVAAIGTGVFADTYSVGNTLPNIIYILMIGGALNAVFVPQLVRHMKDDADGGDGYTDGLLTLTGLALIAIGAVAVVLAPWIVSLYGSSLWTDSDAATATAFARYCLPQIFFYGVFTLLSQVLNARGRFGAPMFAPIVNNLVMIVTAVMFLVIVGTDPTTEGITAGQTALLGIGTTLGVAAQAIVLLPVLRSAGYRYRVRTDFRGYGLGKAAELAKWTVGLVLVNQLAYLVITRLAVTANVLASDTDAISAGITSYQKAHLLFVLPHSIITVSIVTALLPRMSRAAHDGRMGEVADDVAGGMRLIAAMLVPAAVLFVLLGPTIGQLLYGYGSTSPESAALIGLILSMFALGLAPFSLFYVLLRGFYSLEDTRVPFLVTVVLNAVNLAIAVPLFFALPVDLRVPGLALAYSLAYVVTLALTWWLLARRLGGLQTPRTLVTIVRIALAAVLAGAGALLALLGAARLVGESPAGLVVRLAASGLVFAGVYLVLAKVLRVREVADVIALVTARLRRG